MPKRSSSSTEPPAKRSQEAATESPQLPADVFEHMAQFFDPPTFGRVAQTCKRLHLRLNGEAEARILKSMTLVVVIPGAFVYWKNVFRGGKKHGTEHKELPCDVDTHQITTEWYKGRKISKQKLTPCDGVLSHGDYTRVGGKDLRHGSWYQYLRGQPYRTVVFEHGRAVNIIRHSGSLYAQPFF